MRRVLLIGLLLLATACSASTGADTATTTGPTTDTAVAAGPEAPGGASDALAFTATTVTGAAFDGGEYAGKDLMLWFWAPW